MGLKADTKDHSSLWQFVTLDKYAHPSLPTVSAVKTTWNSFKRLLQRSEDDKEPYRKETELQSLSDLRLAHMMEPLQWDNAASALEANLSEWLEGSSTDLPVKYIIGQPFNGHPDILSLLAEKRNLKKIQLPSPQQILSCDDKWLDQFTGSDEVWMLPQLERCYLRHVDGLALIRRLFHLAERGLLGKGVIGCSSWTWSYFQYLIAIPAEYTLTLQAFDAASLQQLISQLTITTQWKTFRFLSAKSGMDVIHIPPDQKTVSDELLHLSWYCRGNVGAAMTYWIKRLQFEADLENDAGDGGEKATADKSIHEEHILVADMPSEPLLQSSIEEECILLLHAVLLHGGISDELFYRVLPFSPSRCETLLRHLYHRGFIDLVDGVWQIRELAYFMVRRTLSVRDYLTDAP